MIHRDLSFSVIIAWTLSIIKILRKARRLKSIESFKMIYISPNRTPKERISRQKLVSELKKKRSDDPSAHYFTRKGKIVKADN